MNTDHIDRKRNEGIAYYEMKRYDQAEQAFKEVLSSDPNDSFTLYLLANCYYIQDRHVDAENICKDLLTGYLAEDAFKLLGKIYREKKQYKKAEECFLRSLELDPQNAGTLAEYSYLLNLCGYFEKADEVMKEALRIDPENSTVLHYKYFFDHAFGSKKKERESIQQYITYSSDEVQKLVKMGLTEIRNKRFKAAREYFRQAFLLEPTNEFILENLKELDRINHFLFFPNRLFSKFHPAMRLIVVPLATAVLTALISLMSDTLTAKVSVYIYALIMILVIWSWLSHPIYKLFCRQK